MFDIFFGMNNFEELIPEYFNFLKEIVDLDNLILAIACDQLQKNHIIKLIRKNIIKNIFGLFNSIAEKKDFKTFYEQFLKNIEFSIMMIESIVLSLQSSLAFIQYIYLKN
jgi:molecular chaperone HtpG